MEEESKLKYDQAMFLFGGSGQLIRTLQPMPGLPRPQDVTTNTQKDNNQN